MVFRAGPSSRAGTVPAEATPIAAVDVLTRTAAGSAAEASRRPGPLDNAGPSEVQLGRLLSRLLAEAKGDPAHERAVRQHMAASCELYATARVREFLLILIERDVRRRLSEA